MKKINNIKYKGISLAFFAVYFITLFPKWYDIGDKTQPGTLVLSTLFPCGIIAISLFVIFNIVFFVRANKLYIQIIVHITNILALIVLILLSIRLVNYWDGFSSLCFSFYISNLSLILSLIFYIADLFKMYKINL